MGRFTNAFLVTSASQLAVLAFGFWLLARIITSSAGWMSDHTEAAQALAPWPSGSFLESLPAAILIAFLWTAGLQLVVTYLISARTHSRHAQSELKSAEEALRRTQDLVRTRDAVIFGLAKLAESRDPETGQHLERIALYCTRLAGALHNCPQYRGVVTPSFVRLIGISSALHDIGKVGIEDAVLLKPGPLSPQERLRMQQHTTVAGDCIRGIERRLGDSNFLHMAREIALYHHERWDGQGYPHGLAGEQIPLSARIVAIADVYDALSTRRVYKEEWTHEQCVQLIERETGKRFDPNLVAVFLSLEPEFRQLTQRLGDSTRESQQRITVDAISDVSQPAQQPELLVGTAV